MARMISSTVFWITLIISIIIIIGLTIGLIIVYIQWRRAEGELENNICPTTNQT